MGMLPREYRKFMRMWLEFISKTASADTAASTRVGAGNATRQMRGTALHEPSQYAEQFMHSPEFLEMAKQATSIVTTLRQQATDILLETHRTVGSLARPDLENLLTADWVL